MIPFTASTRLLFIGDSITDADWRKDPEQLGKGYVRLVRDWLFARDPAAAPLVLNRGISGNKIPDLQKRWDRDVIDLHPDVLSIKIGINDVWHSFAPGREGVTIDRFTAGYRDVLSRTRAALPDCALILCEPSVIWPPVHARGSELLQPYIAAVHAMADEFSAECIVPLHRAFLDAAAARPDVAWTTDGVHPTSLGHTLIARTWLQTTAALGAIAAL
jgi:lysophospholipase L1-like esterase